MAHFWVFFDLFGAHFPRKRKLTLPGVCAGNVLFSTSSSFNVVFSKKVHSEIRILTAVLNCCSIFGTEASFVAILILTHWVLASCLFVCLDCLSNNDK